MLMVVVDDDRSVIYELVRIYEEDKGWEIHYYTNVADALDHVEVIRKADFMLLDLILPEGGQPKEIQELLTYPGLTLLKVLRKEHRTDTPVIVLSVVSRPDIKAELMDLGVGADFILQKPIGGPQFDDVVDQLISH